MEVNFGPRASVIAKCRTIFSNKNDLHGYLDELAVTASPFDNAFCFETKATRRYNAPELRLPGYYEPVLLSEGYRHNGLGVVRYLRSRFCGLSIVYVQVCMCE